MLAGFCLQPSTPFQAYPKAMYHPTLPPRLVKTRAAQEKLGKEWSEKPIQDKDCDRREPQDED